MKIGLISLGCPKNLVDSEVMLGLAREAGHELTGDAASADVIVVNTCAFIDSAKQESVDAILEMARHKKEGACQRLIVTGCLAERYRDHPALLFWHVSNEYGPACYCDRCAARFRAWLPARYGTLDEVNRRWTTAFWSHTYTAWEQISPPGARGDRSVQGLLLDYRRFMSDMNLEC